MSFEFPKREKLKSKKLIDQLFAEGKSISNFPLKLFYLQTTFPDSVKMKTGVAVPKKNFKSAVQRNRIKRLLRESFRLNKQRVFNNSEGNFAFLILYLGNEMPSYQMVERNMQIILEKFIKTIDDEKVD
ncbi:MAG: ribonuclease P protein component [Maribacter sp.]